MEKQTKTIKYFAYVRKSSEGEEKQALSISSQLDKAKEFFSDFDILEVEPVREGDYWPVTLEPDEVKTIETTAIHGLSKNTFSSV